MIDGSTIELFLNNRGIPYQYSSYPLNFKPDSTAVKETTTDYCERNNDIITTVAMSFV